MGVNVAEHFHLTWHRAKKIKKINRKEGRREGCRTSGWGKGSGKTQPIEEPSSSTDMC